MSYSEHDAWQDEISLGDWPFKRWNIGSPKLRQDFDYLRFNPRPGVYAIAYRLRQAFGSKKAIKDLSAALVVASDTVDAAIEHSQAEAYGAWLKHEVWLPVLDESLNGEDSPAEMLVDSLVLIGVGDDFSEQELCAALGLWLIGEFDRHKANNKAELQFWAIEQAAVVLAEAEWHRGFGSGQSMERDRIASRNKKAANHGHIANRENKRRGNLLWQSREWKVQADAERAIATECHVEKAVAGRWIREFKRTPNR